jgi:Peptidase S46
MKIPLRLAIVLALSAALPSFADEGMWLFSAAPRDRLEKDYGFNPSDAWLHHVMKSSIRFNSGGSGSFVSADGLVITNHHVGLDALQKMSNASKNFVRDGFYAAQDADEVKCLDLELNVLESTEDVTARVTAALPAGADANTSFLARRKVIAEIEKESHDTTGLRSDVITLYQGGAFHLYRYKRYTDVRLVFAPEQQAAFFGGDPDNFEYPRYDIDICIFRVYENGKPLHSDDYFKWSAGGPKDGDLVFVPGNPGRTERLFTAAQTAFLRDTSAPFLQSILKRRDVLLTAWSARSDENARRAKEDIFSVRNSRKFYDGLLGGLQDPAIINAKDEAETAFKAKAASLPTSATTLEAYRRIAAAERTLAGIYPRYRLLEGELGFNSELYDIARTLLRTGDERPKANGDRLPEYADQKKDSLELALFSEKPIYDDLETLTLADSLTDLTERLGYGDETVRAVLGGKSPRTRAYELVHGTHVRDLALRHKLYDGGTAAVSAAGDPLIELARSIDQEARALRRTAENATEAIQESQALIGKARFEIQGTSIYPDATFTLRLAYGTVKGYEQDGEPIESITHFDGLYRRSDEHHDKEPFDLPEKWKAARGRVNMATPMDFVFTADIIGGNSGSPTINRDAEFVGIVFDGDIQSLTLDLAYSDIQSRAVSTSSNAILEALRSIYGVNALADELANGHR